MWKKLSVIFLGLICAFSVVYGYYNMEMMAASTSQVLTGRLAELEKGDRVTMSTKYNGSYIGMQLLYPYSGNTWFSMATNPIESGVSSYNLASWTYPCDGNCNLYTNSLLKPYMTALNFNITAGSADDQIIKDRIYVSGLGSGSNMQQQDPTERRYFIPNSHVMALVEPDASKNIIPLNANDLSFSMPYYNDQAYSSATREWQVFGADGSFSKISIQSTAAIRPAAYLDLEEVVFALEPTGSSNADAKVKQPVYNSSNVNSSEGAEMKMRLLDTQLHVTLKSLEKEKISQGSDAKLKVKYGDMSIGVGQTISALISDASGNLIYYKNLGGAEGSDMESEIDISELPVGSYTISLVNEMITTENAPSTSSKLSSKAFEIVNGHKIAYTKTPQTGATLGDYEYSKNVDGGEKVGTITYDGKGVAPITYEVTSFNGADASYENFEIAGLNEIDSSSSSSLDVKIKTNAKDLVSSTNSLKAGVYKFCIISKDANGSPATPTDKTKVCTELEVKKTQPVIKFDADDKGTQLIGGSTTETIDVKQHATHDNTDISGNDHKILYTQKSGVSGLFTGLPKPMDTGGEITITTVKNKDGEIVLQAHIDATENYLAADTTKTLKVALGLEASYVEDKMNIKAGSSEAKPSTTTPIGHISVSGGTSPFIYGFKIGANQNGNFHLDTTTGKIYVDSSVGSSGLTPGSYLIEIEVTDATSPTKQTKTVSKTIVIQEADLAGVAFEDPDHAGTEAGSIITRTYDPSSDGGTFRTKLMETITGSLTGTSITYTVEPTSNAVLERVKAEGEYDYFKIKKGSSASEKGTVLIKAHVTGGAYGSTGKDITIPVNVDPYTQEIEFAQDTPYSIANSVACTSIPATKKSAYWNQDDESNKVTYTSSDPLRATIDADGKLCPVENATGTITLTAALAGDDNYKEATATMTINLISALSGAYIEDKTNITAGSKEAKPSTTDKIGHFTATGGTSGYTYEKKTGTNDNDKFEIKANGEVYVSSGAGANGLFPGEYTIEVEVTDSTKPTAQKATVTKKITIKPASLAVKFEDPDDSSKTIENVITRIFDPSTDPAGGNFHTRLVNTDGSPFAGADVTYSVEADPNDVLEYADMTGDYGNFKVKKASNTSEKNQIKIKAHVVNGYYGSEGEDVTILVNVEKYEQKIKFEQTNPYPLSNTAECTSISATMESIYWNQSATNKIKYTSSDSTKATINAEGQVCPVAGATGTITLIAELAEDDNYKKASATIKVNLLGELSLAYTEDTPLKQAVNPDKSGDTGNAKEEAVFGSVSVSGGLDKRYDIQIKDDDYAHSYFELSPDASDQRTSKLKLKSGVRITADILKAGIDAGVIVQDLTDKDQYNWTMKLLPNTGEEPQEIVVHIIGADPVLTFEKETNGKLTTTYATNGTIDLSVKRGNDVLSTGIKVEGSIGYQTFMGSLAGLTTDAQVNGIDIKKANCDNEDNVISGKNIKVTPSAEASDGYKSGKGIETPIIIKKANHPKVDFIDPDTILQSGVSAVDKGFTGIETDDDHLTITPKEPTTWEGTTFTKHDSGDATEPSVTIKPHGYEGSVVYIVNGGGTDNYKPIENKEIDLFFSSTGGITYKPIKITYGDDTKKVLEYITDGDKKNNTYTYAPVEGSTYLDEENNEILTVEDNTSIITTKQVGETKVNVTRTDGEGNILTQAIPVEVIQKEIILTYESSTIYAGEELPKPSFIKPVDGVLVGSDTIADFPVPAEAAHYKGTEVITDSKTIGTYDTKGEWNSDELELDVNANYKVTIKAGKLTIRKDTPADNWYHLEDPEGNKVSANDWHNYYVDVVLDTATGKAGTYDQISNTETFTDGIKTRFKVTKEDKNVEDVYFRIDPNGGTDHKGAITNTQATVKIDMTKPIIDSITGYPVNTNGLSELINNLTFGLFYKPGVDVTIQASDPQPVGESGKTVSEVKKVTYKIYTLDDKGAFDSTQTPQTGEGTIDANGKISFKINEVGKYRVCAIAEDNATNPSKESCSDLNVKKLDVDEDGDDNPDYRDSDKDGCPDLNIILGNDTAGNPEDKDGNKIKLNVTEKDKNYPYMNIDSDGDGKPDLNIDTDHDGRPDLNLVIMNETLWKPKVCVPVDKLNDYTQPIEYCTGTNAKPSINVDIMNEDGDPIPDGIPDINIDNNGDMKPDLNISKNDKDPYLNIVKFHEWKPKHDYDTSGFFYDSIGTDEDDPKRQINIDTNDDGYPDVNVDLDGDGVPDINIDDDGDEIPDWNIDGNGDGKPDINVDSKGNDGIPDENIMDITEWIPEKIVDGDVPYGTMEIKGTSEIEDNGIIVEKPGGEFLPNTAIKVKDISDTLDESIKKELDKVRKDQEVKKVYDVDYIENNISKQPNGKVNVKIPVDPLVKNAKVVVEKEDGTFEEVKVTEKDGYYVFETDYIGKVSIIGDVEETKDPTPEPDPSPTPTPEPTPNPSTGDKDNPSTSVKGTYTPNAQQSTSGMGGAYTGDSTNILLYIGISSLALGVIFIGLYKRRF